MVTVTQGPLSLPETVDDIGAPAGEYDVGGDVATFHLPLNPEYDSGTLTWSNGTSGFVVTSQSGCLGDQLATPVELVQFADTLG